MVQSKRVVLFVNCIISLSVVASCAHTARLKKNATPEQMYEAAYKDLEDGLYQEAAKVFGAIKTRYPYTPYAALSELRLADCDLKSGQHIEAIEAYRSFIQYHPRHPMAGYAAFKIGEAHMERAPGDWWFMPPAHEKDLAAVKQAVTSLKNFQTQYPNSEYNEEAQDILLQAQTRLAQHELYVSKFYFKRGDWKAAANRADGVIVSYSGTGLEKEAYKISFRSYLELGSIAMAKQRLQSLELHFPKEKESHHERNYLNNYIKQNCQNDTDCTRKKDG